MGTSSAAKPQETSHGWFTALVSAFLEWLLIAFLFFDAVFSYVITKFARGCKLQTPCLLCSRLDHVLGKEKMGYYWDLMCKSHKSEISSLVLCHAHNRLVDVHKMCESCLFSFATINKSNAETYRLLVGKLGEDVNSDFDEDALLGDQKIGSLRERHCACCNQPWVPRGQAQKLIQTRFVSLDAAELETPLSGAIERDHEEVMKKGRGRSSMLVTASHSKNCGLEPLSHLGYTELKMNSDTESEAMLSDDDAGHVSALVPKTNDYREEFSVLYVEPRVVTLDDALVSEKLLNPAMGPETSFLDSHVQVDAIEPLDSNPQESTIAIGQSEQDFSIQRVEPCGVTLDDVSASERLLDPASGMKTSLLDSHVAVDSIKPLDCKPEEATIATGHGLEELNWKDVENKAGIPREEVGDKANIPMPTETLHAAPPSDAIKTPNEVSRNHYVTTTAKVEQTSEAECGVVSRGESLPNTTTETDVTTTAEVEQTSEAECGVVSKGESLPNTTTKTDVTTTAEVEQTSEAECGVVSKGESLPNTKTKTGLEANAVASDSGQQATNVLDLGDAYKLAVDNKGRQLSGVLAEQWLGKDSSRVSEDLKILLSQLSANRGFEQSINDVSPKLSVNSDDSKTLDSSSSIGMQILHKRISLERNESGLSLDGSTVSEIEGESLVDRLKRQVEHDKKLMTALYKELEEERNASAVATNQAMAMITRLQEEKAALHMEALQYLRMMEEQAEYDDEELQKSNDLLAEKEKEVQDLEAELEFYRKKFPNERVLENLSEASYDVKITDIGVDNSEYSCVRDNASVSVHSISEKPHDSHDYGDNRAADMSYENVNRGNANSAILEFEDEKAYILQCLKKLEKTLYFLSDDEASTYLSKDDYSENRTGGVSELGELNCKTQENSGAEETILPTKHDASVSGQDSDNSLLESPELNGRETREFRCSKQSSADLSLVTDVASLGVVVSGLNKRLEALETDRKFLEHAINSLRSGDEGLRFIQDIASHLQELRMIAMRRDQTVA